MKRDLQLKLWLHGNSVHNIEYDECCPDFSCCWPSLLASREERLKFFHCSEEDRMQMLAGFLRKLLVQLCGQEAEDYKIVVDGTDVYVDTPEKQVHYKDGKKIPLSGARSLKGIGFGDQQNTRKKEKIK